MQIPKKVGYSVQFESHGFLFVVKRLSKTTWHLRRTDISSRSRFGTFREIAEDVKAALQYGVLPGGNKGRW